MKLLKYLLAGVVGVVFLSVFRAGAQDRVFITEFVADNDGSLLDQDGDASDWIEIYNTGPDGASLAGWHLTDDAGNLTKWTFPATNLPAGGFLIVFASGKDRAVAGQQLHANFQLNSAGDYLALVKPDGVTVAQAYGPTFPPQLKGVSYGIDLGITTNSLVVSGASLKWKVPSGPADLASDWATTNYNDAGWATGHSGVGFGSGGTNTGAFTNLIQTDVGSVMRSNNATALMRLPFNIPDLPVLDQLKLRMKYDDGFIAYLNGVEVAQRNAPATPAWNSAATMEHSNSLAVIFEDIDLTPFIGLLQEGNNVLAIQGLNLSASDSDFLILPELTGLTVNEPQERYFSQPTPGALNSGSALGVVADPVFNVDRGFYQTPFMVGITSATAGAEIRFTTNGSPPSAVSGTVYTGPINVSRTTVVRAMATMPGWLASGTQTYTYVFLTNVMSQKLQTVTNLGFPASWPGTTPDYDMDPTVTGPNAAQMEATLRSLPAVFLTTSISNWFDPNTGIYVHPTSHGLAWERAGAIEMVTSNGTSEFGLGCGLRIQGGAFRDFSFTQKKSLRVLFKSEYGAGKLHYDLFHDPTATQDFDGLVFRAGGNDGYAWGAAGTTVQFTRDEFGRRLQLAMGHPSAHGMFVHMYLNGLYWGLYNLTERPNEDFSASYFGGDASDWDAITSKQNIKSGDLTAWNSLSNQVRVLTSYADYQKLQGNNVDGARNPAYPVLYDKTNYMDYMLLNIWGGNWDWPDNNYWIGRKRTADSTGFKFYEWDFENTLGNNLSRSPVDMVSPKASDAGKGVGYPHFVLKSNAEYRVDFADRVQQFLLNGGLLSVQVLTNRYKQIANEVEPAILAESARWGDDNHLPPYGLAEWYGERDWILTNYLPQRTAIVLQQLRTNGLYPSIGAPIFNQYSGVVTQGFALVISQTNFSGTIFYTTDGSDPRVAGTGAIGPGAQAYLGPVPINAPTQVRARVSSGGQWSAMVEGMFFPPQDLSRLALTEIMYHAPSVGATNGDEYDFIELKNVGASTLNLSGLTFTAGVTFTFTNGTTVAPGQFFLLARNPSAMAMKYPGVTVNGIFTGKLDNGGETITLSHPLGGTIFSVTYDDAPPWPSAADGLGFSLVPKEPGLTQAPDDGAKWRASRLVGGSPGGDDFEPGIPGVVINEILTHTDPPLLDSVELYNPTAAIANIGGWYLTDDRAVPTKYRIPNGTVLPAGGYVLFTETQFNAQPGTSNSFAFSAAGDDAYLFSADASGQLAGYSHGVVFGAAFNGVSFGRYMNSAGEEQFPAQTGRTLGFANSGPRVGPVVINEIHYHPASGGDEFVELLNVTRTSVPLYDVARPTNTWKLNGVGYTFPAGITMRPGELLLLVPTNPPDFRAKYGVAAGVQVLGPYSGILQDGGELLELQAPDAPNSNAVPYVTIDAVRYNDKAPWPPGADGAGASLQRISALAYGNEPTNWMSGSPTPGAFSPTSDADGDGLPDMWEMAHGTDWLNADAGADPDGDGFSNWQEYLAGTDPQDANSCLRLTGVVAGGVVNLQFLAIANHTYSLLSSSSAAGAGWSKLADVAAQPTNGAVMVSDTAPAAGARFYRVVTPGQP